MNGNMAAKKTSLLILLAILASCATNGGGSALSRPRANSRVVRENHAPPTLTSNFDSSNHVKVCLGGRKIGQRFYFTVYFEALPRPNHVQWVLQAKQGRKTIIDEDEHHSGFRAYALEVDEAATEMRNVRLLIALLKCRRLFPRTLRPP